MYKTVSILFLVVLAFVVQITAQTPSVTSVPYNGVSIYYLNQVIGQSDFFSANLASAPTASSLSSPISICSTASGLFVGDYSDKRVLMYSNPSTSSVADLVFGQPDFTSNSDGVFEEVVGINVDTQGNLIVSDYAKSRIDEFSASSNKTLTSAINPAFAFGVATRPTEGTDSPIGTSTGAAGATIFRSLLTPKQVATDPLVGVVYVADFGNNRIVRFPQGPRAISGPTGVIGAADYISNTCTPSATRTCINSPTAVTVDCYQGIWVATRVGDSYQIYRFAKQTQLATFAISAPASLPNDWEDVWSMDFDPTCRYLAVATGSKSRVYILDISFDANGAPIGVGDSVVIGNLGLGAGATPSNTTDSIGNAYSVAWDATSAGTLWVADYFNHRVVSVNPFLSGPVANPSAVASNQPIRASPSSSNSPVPSPSPTVGGSETGSSYEVGTPEPSSSSAPVLIGSGASSLKPFSFLF